jgi:hypothetical protein
MSIARSVTEVLRDRVTLAVEGIDRLYLNVYVPRLQSESGVAAFFRFHRGHAFASSALILLCQTESRGLAFLQRFVVKSSPGGI